MSKPIFSDLFTFSGRRNRQSFILFHVAAVAVMLFSFLFLAASAHFVGIVLWLLLMIPLTIAGFAVTAQRIRDFGYSGCWVFLYLIPYVGFAASVALYFIPSNSGENQYGPSCID